MEDEEDPLEGMTVAPSTRIKPRVRNASHAAQIWAGLIPSSASKARAVLDLDDTEKLDKHRAGEMV